MENNYLEMKQNYENEQNKLMNLDKNFYEYKKEKNKLEQEIKELTQKELKDIFKKYI